MFYKIVTLVYLSEFVYRHIVASKFDEASVDKSETSDTVMYMDIDSVMTGFSFTNSNNLPTT